MIVITHAYDAVWERSLAVIREKGKPVTVTHMANPDGAVPLYDAAHDRWSEGAGAPAVRVTAHSMAVQINVTPLTLMVDANAVAFDLTQGMTLEWAGKAQTIMHAEAVAPNGTPVIWVVRV